MGSKFVELGYPGGLEGGHGLCRGLFIGGGLR